MHAKTQATRSQIERLIKEKLNLGEITVTVFPVPSGGFSASALVNPSLLSAATTQAAVERIVDELRTRYVLVE